MYLLEDYNYILFPILFFIAEGFIDFYVWKASTNKKFHYTKKWHKIKFIEQFIIAFFIAYNFSDIYFIFYYAFTRIVFFNATLNLLRGRKIYYFSKNSNIVDKHLSKFPKLSYTMAVISTLIFLYLIIF